MRPKATTPAAVRFWAKVNKTEDCWLWTASIDPINGYGKFCPARGVVTAHRYSWELANGPIPDGLCVLHRCDVRPCVNPAHLWLGTNADNTHDMFSKGRGAVGDRHPARARGDYLPRGDAHQARIDASYLPRGEAHVNSKLTGDSVREIRRRYAGGGISQASLAAEFNVHAMTVNAIIRRETWKHV